MNPPLSDGQFRLSVPFQRGPVRMHRPPWRAERGRVSQSFVSEGGESKVAKRERNGMMMVGGKRELVMSFGRLEW